LVEEQEGDWQTRRK